MDNQANRDRWIKQHGRCVLDFGAGHLHETRILRKLGISVTPFEPYRVNDGDEIDKAESIALTREFLHAIGTDKLRWSSIFISSVLNSVPFHADRQHIACICAALADDATKLYAVASASNHINLKQLSGYHSLNERQSGAVLFKLDYEPGITLGDIATSPKVQKYHLAVAKGQSYSMNGRSLTLANTREIREQIQYWERRVASLESANQNQQAALADFSDD